MLCLAALPVLVSIPVDELADEEQLLALPSRSSLLIALMDGAVVRSQRFSLISLSRISQENICGCSRRISSIRRSMSGDTMRGLLPPITPGLMLPVSWITGGGKKCNSLVGRMIQSFVGEKK